MTSSLILPILVLLAFSAATEEGWTSFGDWIPLQHKDRAESQRSVSNVPFDSDTNKKVGKEDNVADAANDLRSSPTDYKFHKAHKGGYNEDEGKKGKSGYHDSLGHKKNHYADHEKIHKKGHHDKGSKEYNDQDYKKNKYGEFHKGENGKKGDHHHKKGYSRKGHKDKGFKNVYYKEEYGHSKKFYDDSDLKEHHKKYDDFDLNFKDHKGNTHKRSKNEGHKHHDKYGKKGNFLKGKNHEDSTGKKKKYGHKENYDKHHKAASKSEDHKKYGNKQKPHSNQYLDHQSHQSYQRPQYSYGDQSDQTDYPSNNNKSGNSDNQVMLADQDYENERTHKHNERTHKHNGGYNHNKQNKFQPSEDFDFQNTDDDGLDRSENEGSAERVKYEPEESQLSRRISSEPPQPDQLSNNAYHKNKPQHSSYHHLNTTQARVPSSSIQSDIQPSQPLCFAFSESRPKEILHSSSSFAGQQDKQFSPPPGTPKKVQTSSSVYGETHRLHSSNYVDIKSRPIQLTRVHPDPHPAQQSSRVRSAVFPQSDAQLPHSIYHDYGKQQIEPLYQILHNSQTSQIILLPVHRSYTLHEKHLTNYPFFSHHNEQKSVTPVYYIRNNRLTSSLPDLVYNEHRHNKFISPGPKPYSNGDPVHIYQSQPLSMHHRNESYHPERYWQFQMRRHLGS